MSTIRVSKDKNFSVINNTVLDDTRLTWKAKGIAAYLLSKPDDWKIVRESLIKQSDDGETAVRSALQELEECGYLVRTRKQNESGHFEWESVLHETPLHRNPKSKAPDKRKPPMGKPVVEKPQVVLPVVENQGLLNTVVLSTDLPNIEKARERALPDHSEPAQPAAPTQSKPSLPQKPIASQEKPVTQKQVTSPHLDPRKFKDGYIEHGKGETPVEIYYERFSFKDKETKLAAPLEDDLRKCTDLDRFRAVITAYSQTTYKRRNIKLILDWYRDGVPAYAQPDSSPASQAAKPALLPLKRWCLNKYNIDNPRLAADSYNIPEDMIHAQYEQYRQQYQQAH